MVIEKIKNLCENKGVSISKLEKTLGYGNGSIMKASSISADRLLEIADFFQISIDELLDRNGYARYVNQESINSLELLKYRPEMQVLLDASKDISREDIMLIVQIIERMRK